MISAEQLQRFSRECLLLRQVLKEGESIPDLDYRILKSNLQILLMDLEKGRTQPSPWEKPIVQDLTR